MLVKYPRKGLRMRSEKGVHEKVRDSCMNFAVFLRMYYEFPIRVVVYLKNDYQIQNSKSKELVSATFLGPFSKLEEPYIRIATGDFEELKEERGESDALWAILGSIAHEIVHYKQWLDDRDYCEEEAELEAEKIIDKFYNILE